LSGKIAPSAAEFQPAAPSLGGGYGATNRINLAPGGHSRGYSRFVSLAKYLLPVVALVLIFLITAWPHLDSDDLRFRLGFAAIQLGAAEDPSMINPRFVGADKSDRAYSLTADLARRLSGNAALVELEMPKADITLSDGTWLVLTADTGVFGADEQKLNLSGAVNLYHDSGYEFRTQRAAIDLAAGQAEGHDSIEGQGPFGRLKAEGFRLVNRGNVIHFTGKAQLVMHSGAGKSVQ